MNGLFSILNIYCVYNITQILSLSRGFVEACFFKPGLLWGSNCFKSRGSFETADAGDDMGDAVADEGGISGNGRGTGLLCACGTLFMRCSLIVWGTTGVTKRSLW